ncbi:MAG: cell division protein FtsQ/DivIB [Sulfobacillus sp.]
MASRRLIRRRVLTAVAALAVAAALVWLVLAGPWFTIRQIRVQGGPAQLFQDTGLKLGQPLFSAPLIRAQQTLLARAPWLASATVSALFPDQLLISVTLRRPVALAFVGAGDLIGLDASGVTLPVTAKDQAAYPYLTGVLVPATPYQKVASSAGLGALTFLLDLPLPLRSEVSELVVSKGQVSVYLLAGTEVALGAPTSLSQKASLLAQILAQAQAKGLIVTRVDLSQPAAPAVTATP